MSNEPDEVNNGALATILVIVAFATLGIALVVTSLVREETGALQAQKGGTQENEYRDLKAAQLAEITAAPTWRDREKGLVSVPIDRAMEIVTEAVRENPLNLSPGSPPAEEEEEVLEEGVEGEAELEAGSETEATNPAEEPTEKKALDTVSAPGAQKAAPVQPAPTQPTPAPTKPAPTQPAPTPAPVPAP